MRRALIPARALGLALCLTACGPAAPPFQVEVTDASVRPTRPGVPHSAAYFDLKNTGSATAQLTGATADGVQAVELHRTVAADGVARMEPVDGVTLAPGASAAFAPGGLHVMLIGVERALAEGDTFGLALVFDSGDTVQVAAPVSR